MEDNTSITDRPDQSRFELRRGDEVAALIDYRLSGKHMNLVHTEVVPAHEGKGLGSQIVKFALDQARERKLEVVPSCSFVRAFVQRHPEYQDLLHES